MSSGGPSSSWHGIEALNRLLRRGSSVCRASFKKVTGRCNSIDLGLNAGRSIKWWENLILAEPIVRLGNKFRGLAGKCSKKIFLMRMGHKNNFCSFLASMDR